MCVDAVCADAVCAPVGTVVDTEDGWPTGDTPVCLRKSHEDVFCHLRLDVRLSCTVHQFSAIGSLCTFASALLGPSSYMQKCRSCTSRLQNPLPPATALSSHHCTCLTSSRPSWQSSSTPHPMWVYTPTCDEHNERQVQRYK